MHAGNYKRKKERGKGKNPRAKQTQQTQRAYKLLGFKKEKRPKKVVSVFSSYVAVRFKF